jgi:DNA-binding HxlR family transcriptional regulator
MQVRKRIFTDTNCPTEVVAVLIGGKWKTIILSYLLERPYRFGELSRHIPNASKRILTLQLRELEEDGIIHREVFKQVPPRVEYSLTPLGASLRPLIVLMAEWGYTYLNTK